MVSGSFQEGVRNFLPTIVLDGDNSIYMFVSKQVRKLSCVQIWKNISMQVCMCVSMQACKYENM